MEHGKPKIAPTGKSNLYLPFYSVRLDFFVDFKLRNITITPLPLFSILATTRTWKHSKTVIFRF